MASDDTTDSLFARAGEGDLVAFEEVFDRIFPRVLNVAYAVLREYARAEEVAQEVMVEIWRIAPTVDSSEGSVAGWAPMIAHRRAKRPGPLQPDGPETRPSSSHRPRRGLCPTGRDVGGRRRSGSCVGF